MRDKKLQMTLLRFIQSVVLGVRRSAFRVNYTL